MTDETDRKPKQMRATADGPGRSEEEDASDANVAGSNGPSAGDPGGMGGVRASTPGRPPGGNSPVD